MIDGRRVRCRIRPCRRSRPRRGSGAEWQIVDIGMRMLTPRELFRAQGFPDSYVIAPKVGGKALTKTAQIRMCGNSVCPDVARAIVAANVNVEPEEVAA